MSKWIKCFACCVLLALQMLLISACSLTYSYVEDNENKIGYGYSKFENNRFVADFTYS